MPPFRKGDEPLAEPYDAEIIEFASKRTQDRLKQLKRGPAYEAIIAKVRAKYGPGLQEWNGIKDLTFNFQNLAVQPETQDVPMSAGRRRKYRGGVPTPMTPMTAQKTSGPAPVTNTLTQNVINDAKKLWLSGMAALGTPETVGTTLALGAVGVANPSAAAGAFTFANQLVGVAYGLVTPTTFTLAVLTALLYRNFGNYLEQTNKEPPPTNLQEMLTEVKKNLGSAVASKKYGSVRMPSAEIMAALDKLEKAAAAEKAAAEAKTAAEAQAATQAATTAEKEAKVAVDQTITASQSAVDSTIPAGTPSTTGGRNTKKRGLKKARKTRRGIRKPLFRY